MIIDNLKKEKRKDVVKELKGKVHTICHGMNPYCRKVYDYALTECPSCKSKNVEQYVSIKNLNEILSFKEGGEERIMVDNQLTKFFNKYPHLRNNKNIGGVIEILLEQELNGDETACEMYKKHLILPCTNENENVKGKKSFNGYLATKQEEKKK